METSQQERGVCVTLEVVYDDSDSMTDYYAPDRTLWKWRLMDVGPRPRITEPLLRRALERLPGWLRSKSWTYRKGEKYSMSDHPYGQMRGEALGLEWSYGYGGRSYQTKALALLIDTDSRLGEEYDRPVPESFEAMRDFITALSEERKAQEAKTEAYLRSPEAKTKRIQSEINQWRSLTAVFDERGFRQITPEERADKIAALEKQLAEAVGPQGSI